MSSDLPPPHADESASLRQDIADELADHLAAAVADERARGAEEAVAREAALNRFGDPAAVARQLWLEAMKEPIMRQRTLMIAAALLVLGVFAANGLAWMAFQQLRESNAALVAQLEASDSKDRWGQFADLTVKLVKDNEAKTPAEGYTVSLSGQAVPGLNAPGHGGYGRQMVIDETANSEGVVRYAPIQPGVYELRVDTPWGWSLRRSLSLLARAWTEPIVCPAAAPTRESVTIEFAWPEEMSDPRLAVHLEFQSRFEGRHEPTNKWTPPSSTFSRLIRRHDGATVMGSFSPERGLQAAVPPQVYPGLYVVNASVVQRGQQVGNDDNAHRYVQLMELTDGDLESSRFVVNPGSGNVWRIALSARGLERVRREIAGAHEESAKLESILSSD